MKTIFNKIIAIAGIAALLVACGGNDDLAKKKETLDQLKEQATDLRIQISELENEIMALDPEYAESKNRSVVVTTLQLEKSEFEHQIEVRGNVASRQNVQLTAESMGTIIQVNVNPGDVVKKGQTLVKLDAEVMQNTIKELRTGLSLAATVFEKQAALWEQGIGSEIQYLEAKNRKESLESQLATANARLNNMTVKAPFNGVIDDVIGKVGEMAQPGMPLATMVSNEEMYLEAQISERYIGKFKKGDKVTVYLPAMNEVFSSDITSVGYVINPANRTFTVEVKLPVNSEKLKPNQLVMLKLTDYRNEKAVAVPTHLIQRDATGDFVYLVESNNEHKTARKQYVKRGLSYNLKTEIVEGLSGTEMMIDKGAREVVNGIQLQLEKKGSMALNSSK